MGINPELGWGGVRPGGERVPISSDKIMSLRAKADRDRQQKKLLAEMREASSSRDLTPAEVRERLEGDTEDALLGNAAARKKQEAIRRGRAERREQRKTDSGSDMPMK